MPPAIASEFAEQLETAAHKASASPSILGRIGEVEGFAQRRLGATEVRIRLAVKHTGKIQFELRQQTQGLGKQSNYSTLSISPKEASKFAGAIRSASAKLEPVA